MTSYHLKSLISEMSFSVHIKLNWLITDEHLSSKKLDFLSVSINYFRNLTFLQSLFLNQKLKLQNEVVC